MTTTNTKPMHSFSEFLRYMTEVESHNGVDDRFIMSMTRGPISLGSARADFTRLMAGKDRVVESIATLHSAAPGECELIAAMLETEQGLEPGSIEKHDPEVVEWYMTRVLEAEDRSAPGTAGLYVAQVDGKSGLLHVHGQRLNVMLRDVEVPVKRRVYEREDDWKTIKRDAQGKRIPKRDSNGEIVYEQKVEKVKAGQALPPSMRDSLRAGHMVDAVWLEHGIDNAGLVSRRPRRGAPRAKGHTYEDRARAYLDALEANRTSAMTVDDLVAAIRADGHGATLRGKTKQGITFDFVEENGAHHLIRTQRLSTPERDYSLPALIERMGVEPVVEVTPPAPVPDVEDRVTAAMAEFEAATKQVTLDEDAIRARFDAVHERKMADDPVYRRAHESMSRSAETPVRREPAVEVEEVAPIVEPAWLIEARRWYTDSMAAFQGLVDDEGFRNDEETRAWLAHRVEILRDDLRLVEEAGEDGRRLMDARFDRLEPLTTDEAEEEFKANRRKERARRQSTVVEQAHEAAQAVAQDVETNSPVLEAPAVSTRTPEHVVETEVESAFEAEIKRINGQVPRTKKPTSALDRRLATHKKQREERERRQAENDGLNR